MGENKFRAWNTDNDRYEYSGSVQFDGVIVAIWGKDKYDWILEQYTGLLDRNGKEIFEGDIVRAWIDFGPGGEGLMVYPVTMNPHGVNLQEWTFREEGFLPEIIGNIHENVELLNEGN